MIIYTQCIQYCLDGGVGIYESIRQRCYTSEPALNGSANPEIIDRNPDLQMHRSSHVIYPCNGLEPYILIPGFGDASSQHTILNSRFKNVRFCNLNV